MRATQLNPHTVRSHGATVARTHAYDWLILIILAVTEVILARIDPFNLFVGKYMMDHLKYPLKDSTIPLWAVPVFAVVVPGMIFLFIYYRRRDVYDLHHAILGVLFSVVVAAVLTDAIKIAVGRPRPNFFWRCFPDGVDVYHRWGNVVCHGKRSVVIQGHKSFPSAHTSFKKQLAPRAFAGLGFLSLYLSGKIKAFDRRGHVAKLCIVFLPLLVASMVAISRVDDYWHHWGDVFAGGILGLTVATFCYLQFFPPPYHVEGWGPYAYFRALEESRPAAEANNTTVNPQTRESHIENQRDEGNGGFIGMSLAGDSRLADEDVESGRSANNRTLVPPRIPGLGR